MVVRMAAMAAMAAVFFCKPMKALIPWWIIALQSFKAQNGEKGRGRNCSAKRRGFDFAGASGTMVYDEDTDELIADLTIMANQLVLRRVARMALVMRV